MPPSPRGELAGAHEARRPGADNGDSEAVGRRSPADLDAVLERAIGRVALERADRDRPLSGLGEHAGGLAQDLDGAHPRATRAEQVLGKDRLRGAGRVVRRDRAHELRDIDAGGAGDHAGRGRVGAAALEAAVGIEQRLRPGERRTQLLENRPVCKRSAHVTNASSRAWTCSSRWTGVSRASVMRQASSAYLEAFSAASTSAGSTSTFATSSIATKP